MFGHFELRVGEKTPHARGYPVRVDSTQGPAQGDLILDLDDPGLQADLVRVQGIDPDLKLRQRVGSRLFEALFQGDVRDAWSRCRGYVDAGRIDGLHLRLEIESPPMAALPWELLRDEAQDEFLATAADLGVARFLPVREPPQLPDAGPLRVLVVVESPPGVPAIDPPEVKRLEEALRGLGAKVQVEVLRNAAVGEIHNALQRDFHVLHYLGHGGRGRLILTSEDGTKAAPIEDQDFAQLVLGRRSLRLIVLNACHSALAGGGRLFDGIGPALVRKRMPAVVAMQYPTVQLDTAGRFSAAFYKALALGRPVDVAVNQARQLLSAQFSASDRDWSTPVLYLGTRSFRVLDPGKEEAHEVEQAWKSVRESAQDPGARAALTELAQRFQEVSARHRSLRDLLDLAHRLSDLRAAFGPCARFVEQTRGNAAALPIQLLRTAWAQVRQHALNALVAFVGGRGDLGQASWYPALVACGTRIDIAFGQIALGVLAAGIAEMDGLLAQAEIQVREQLDRAITDLVTLSDQTLPQTGWQAATK
jgi:hypothetical protein